MLVVVPLAGTIWILKALIVWSDNFVIGLLPEFFRPSFLEERALPGAGLVLTVSIILLAGVFTRLYLGKWLISAGDKLIAKVPFGRSVYGALKQILEAAFTPGDQKFKGVALVEFPKEGSYTLAFITKDSPKKTSPDPDKKFIRVFVPTTPNPTSGYMLILEEHKVRRIEMSIEEATKIIISGGLLD